MPHTPDPDDTALPGATRSVQVQRWRGGLAQPAQADQVIAEAPVALVFNGLSHVVMMATPADLEDMALGFALSEGLLPDASHCLGMDVVAHAAGIEVRMQITARCFEALKGRRRHMEGRSGCGLCGIDSLRAFQDSTPPSAAAALTPAGTPWPAQALVRAALAAVAALPEHQRLNADTGGCHAAGWADAQGHLRCVREDVGRHNALDKLIGALARQGLLGQRGLVAMSSRASVELVRKCARTGLGALATISAPTSMAIEQARLHGLHLLAFCRAEGLVRYDGLGAETGEPAPSR